ncbi:DUF443 family protein [Virgibacillus sp. 179-BFC.A HS]|uniref:DUF443 family protein n=1 Tax=Tigheibacillus jepli TaxID=3035914 RepID=A0ABU5CCQ0_9BACI|nr:DUF443 family protein [Virgibacillus sp. 179-BFC.A HS]MDY0404079.1 DUF443 family protein [Virgibacillus sp. 179-BFC.A HS]
MEADIQYVHKNNRYKLLRVNGENYIIDVDRPYWIIFFPIVYWFFPHTVFKIDRTILKQLQTPIKQTKTSYFSIFGAGISLLLANLLSPLMNYFDIQTTPLVNTIILVPFLLVVLFFRFHLSKHNQKKLYHVVPLDQLQPEKIWIRPKSVKHFLGVVFFYLFLLAFAVLSCSTFIDPGNIMMLLFSLIVIFLVLIMNMATTVVGKTKVKFSHSKKVV